MDMAVVAVGLYETYQSALMMACLVGFVVFSLLTVVAAFLRLNIVAAIRRVRIRGGLIGLTLFALAMLFNSYPTHADKNRGSGAGELPPQSVPEVVPDGGGEGVGEAVFQVAESFDPDDATQFPAWTNDLATLQVTGFAAGLTSVWIRASWPVTNPPASSVLDVFAARDCDTNIWTLCGSVQLSSATNEVVIEVFVSEGELSSCGRQFFRVGTIDDSDGDGLSDAYERLVSQTSQFSPDTDGDGLPDGWEYENGLDPNLWADAYADPDGDGIPNLYEYHNGTMPQVADAGSIERIIAGGSGSNAVETLSAALAASQPYSVIEVVDGIHEGPGWSGFNINLPEHPVLITSSNGGRSRRAIIRHTAQMAAMYLNATQTTHTVVQGLSYVLAATNGMQMAFWCGGNLPWSGAPAAGMFRDIYVRMPNPGVEYEGWFFRHYESNEVVIASCTVNALGATSARGIYAVDSPPMSVENCTFVSFPSNDGGLGYGIQYESTTQNWGGAPDPIPLGIVNCLFDSSFTNAYALAPLENGIAYEVSMVNCIVPSALEYEADYAEGLIVTNAGVSFSGHIANDSPARGAGVASLYAPLDIDGQDRGVVPDIGADAYVPDAGSVDTDGDGLSDAAEDARGTDPFFADSDWDGSPDAAEIANGTDPMNRFSHRANVTLMVTNTYASASVTNYLGFSWSAVGWDVTNVYATTCWGMASNVVDDTTSLYGKAFSDLNRNGVYDEGVDVIRVVSLASDYAIVNATIALGDIDGDGVPDASERNDGTDPYDKNNFLLHATIKIMDSDTGQGITNYVFYSTSLSNVVLVASNAFAVATNDYAVSCVATEGRIFVRGFRDLNANGVYDDGVDGIFSCDLNKGSNGKTVNLTIGDSDHDNIQDSEEIHEGTSPTNPLNYCFNCSVEFSGIFSTTNNLVAQALLGESCLYGPVVQTNKTLILNFGHLVITNGERVVVNFWDDFDGDMIMGDGEPFSTVTVFASAHDAQYRYSLPSGGFDANKDGLMDWWQTHYQLEGGMYDDTDGDGLINLYEYWVGTNPTVPDGSNTVLSVMTRSIDDRILYKSTNDMSQCCYLNYGEMDLGVKLIANTNCWAYGIDTSCASPWNQRSQHRRAGTAISSRHVLFARHFDLDGGEIYFRMSNGEIHTNEIVSILRHPDSSIDVSVGMLAHDLPSGIRPAKILPQDYYSYIKNGQGLPSLCLDQEEHALVHDISALASNVSRKYPIGKRNEFCEEIIIGDSGNPVFLVMGNDVILLCTFYFGGAGSGPSVQYYRDDIQALMDELSGAAGLDASNYRLVEYDFGGFEPCIN